MPQLCLNCAPTAFASTVPQLCPNCAPSNFMPQLCPNVFNFVPQLCLNCAPTVPQPCLARLPSCRKIVMPSRAIPRLYRTSKLDLFGNKKSKLGLVQPQQKIPFESFPILKILQKNVGLIAKLFHNYNIRNSTYVILQTSKTIKLTHAFLRKFKHSVKKS